VLQGVLPLVNVKLSFRIQTGVNDVFQRVDTLFLKLLKQPFLAEAVLPQILLDDHPVHYQLRRHTLVPGRNAEVIGGERPFRRFREYAQLPVRLGNGEFHVT
jgi:hypothetical protein